MGTIASQMTSLKIVFSTVYLDTDQRKHQSSASLVFVRGMASNAENVSIWWRHHAVLTHNQLDPTWSHRGEIWIRIQTLLFNKMHLKMPLAIGGSFCSDLDVPMATMSVFTLVQWLYIDSISVIPIDPNKLSSRSVKTKVDFRYIAARHDTSWHTGW